MSLWLCGTSLFARPSSVLPAQSGQLIIAPCPSSSEGNIISCVPLILRKRHTEQLSLSQDSSIYLVVYAFEVLLLVGLQKRATASLLPQNHIVYPIPSLEDSSAKLSSSGWLPSLSCGRAGKLQMLHC